MIRIFICWLSSAILLIGIIIFICTPVSPYEECKCDDLTTDMCITLCTGDVEPANPITEDEDAYAF